LYVEQEANQTSLRGDSFARHCEERRRRDEAISMTGSKQAAQSQREIASPPTAIGARNDEEG